MTIEEYRELLESVKVAQGRLNAEVYKDLQRLASAESDGTKMRITMARNKGMEKTWELARYIANASDNEKQEVFGTYRLDIIFNHYSVDAAKELVGKYRAEHKEQPGPDIPMKFIDEFIRGYSGKWEATSLGAMLKAWREKGPEYVKNENDQEELSEKLEV